MKHEVTELVFLIDRSGSMAGLEDDTIGGFNTMLKQQQAVEGDAYVTVVLFDDRYELLCDHEDIRQVKPLTARDYVPQGSTALLDAIERTIHRIKKTQEDTGVREKVLFFILTDGQENSSLRCTFPMIRSQIAHQKEKYGWEFVFFGSEIWNRCRQGTKLPCGFGWDNLSVSHDVRCVNCIPDWARIPL